MNSIFNDINVYRVNKTDRETIGFLTCNINNQSIKLRTLELPWKDNKEDVSCIPTGTYKYKKWFSPHFNRTVLRLENVPNRTNILIHPANYVSELRGCIAVGLYEKDINNDGLDDVSDSVYALKNLVDMVNDTGYVNIS